MLNASAVPGLLGSPGDGGAAVGGPAPMDAGPWVDEFDDTSKVNFTQNTQVVGGQVELTSGHAAGLLASVAITPPQDYKYDMLVLQVDAPGGSSVKASVLNATQPSTKVGFVNEPIPGFLKVDRTSIPLTGIGTARFPSIRLQADLEAAGTDRPALLRWEVTFVPGDTWRDEYHGDGKVDSQRRVVFTGDHVEIDMGMRNRYLPGYGDHQAFPPIVVNRYTTQSNSLQMGAYYPNAARDDYRGRANLYAENPLGFIAGDVDADGHVDLVVANLRDGGDYTRDSYILWGNESGTFDVSGRRTDLATYAGRRPALGDLDGDGDLDVLVSCGGGPSTGHVRVFMNPGNRAFGGTHDISLPGEDINGLASADLNDDGYDDVVLAENHAHGGSDHSRVYMSGPAGPDTTADIYLETGLCFDVELFDFDEDGDVDVAFACNLQVNNDDRAHVYLGEPDGPDATSDYQLDVPESETQMSVASGDLDGDGRQDLVFGRYGSGPRMYVFWGTATGYSNNQRSDPQVGSSIRDVAVIDVNKDGYDDVVSATYYRDRIDIYHGSATGIDGNQDKRIGNVENPNAIAVVVDRRQSDHLHGSFVTSSIIKPQDMKWDVLVLEGDFPEGTETEVTILDANLRPVMGYEGLQGTDFDISGVDITSFHLQVTLRSYDLVSTPRLDRMFLKWMEVDEWREEFYGEAKIDGLQGLKVSDGELMTGDLVGSRPEIVFSNLRDDRAYNKASPAYRDAGGLDYRSMAPLSFPLRAGAGDVEVADLDGDGFQDAVFAIYQTSSTNYRADSPVYLGSPVGFDTVAGHKFPTKGARDVLVEDLNLDGHMDVVFAQEQDDGDYIINSTLFWGSSEGWNYSADVEFATTGASGVEAADVDRDGLPDLAFACYRNAGGTAVDSMVFLQTEEGFDGSAPDHRLATKGARDVAAGDIDGNGRVDLVFANSFSGGFADIFSYVYWGLGTGGFSSTPANLATHGAEDVVVAPVNDDPHPDVVFACGFNNAGNRLVDSFVYLGRGSQSIGPDPDASLPTSGASGVAVADLDGTGWKDLVFSCKEDGATYEINSRVYLGGASGYGSSPDVLLPTKGATGVAVADLVPKDVGGYLSQVISPIDPVNAGVFHTFRYSVLNLPAGHEVAIRVLDSDSGDVLAETTHGDAQGEWYLGDKFRIREHDAIQVTFVVEGLSGQTLRLDDLWLNWTPRNRQPPRVVHLQLSDDSVLRTQAIEAVANVTDEYDYLEELTVEMEARLSNSSDLWTKYMISDPEFLSGNWTATIKPRVDIPVGMYDLRVRVIDTDGMESPWMVLEEAFRVVNNLPSVPDVRIEPAMAVTTSTLKVEFTLHSLDIESTTITYSYRWFRDGEPVANLTSDQVPPEWLVKGQNWSVEVRAFDGDDEGPPGRAWRVISNAPPVSVEELPDPRMEEDTTDSSWLVLKNAFEDPDGDDLAFRAEPMPLHVGVDIDPGTGRVTLVPEGDWFGTEEITFVASDGEFEVSQTVAVEVTPVNDHPTLVSIDGKDFSGGTIHLEVVQGQERVIEVVALDVEGDELFYRVTATEVELDMTTGWLTITPTNLMVGWLNFSLSVNDIEDIEQKQWANFSVKVLNANDPMEAPRIISPREEDSYKWNETVPLRGTCSDPDEMHGQVLEYSWSSNISGFLGEGVELTHRFTDAGVHRLTLTVTDGEFSKEVFINFTVRERPAPPPPPPDGDEEGGIPIYALVGIALVVVVAVALLVVVSRRRGEEEEEVDRAAFELTEEERMRKELEGMAAAVKATADAWEAERETPEAEDESIEVAGTGMVPSSEPSHRMRLSETTTDETARLWASMEAEEPSVDEAEKEALRKENERRKVQSAIQALPYGIPAPALRQVPAHILAEEIVDAPRHELPDGTPLVAIRGKWYHGDPEDSSKFLMPYEEKVEEQPSTEGWSEWEESG